MGIEDFVSAETGWLENCGFSLAEHRTGLRLAGQIWRFTSGLVDVEFRYDRLDEMNVGCGAAGGTTFDYGVWANLLGIPYETNLKFEEQWSFFKSHMSTILEYSEALDHLEDDLTEINRGFVRDALGLNSGSSDSVPARLRPRGRSQ